MPISSSRAGAVVGVDRGGTWIRVQALSATGQSIATLRSPSPSIEDLPAYLKKVFRQWRLKPVALAVASRGLWTAAEQERVKRSCRLLAKRIAVMSDVEAAWLAAFDDRSAINTSEGILVISGTGSIAYGRDSRGRVARAGGWGPLLGDEGSAFWIGREWIKTQKSQPPRGYTAATIAAYSAEVWASARKGHRQARRILHEAQQHLATLARDLAKTLDLKTPIPFSWAGSVLDEESFREGFLKILMTRPNQFLLVPPSVDPATAAARRVLH